MPKVKSQLLKTLITLAVAIVAMLLFRAAVVTVCCVEGEALQPVFLAGDRVLVNRWSYGLRTGGNSLLSYNRLWRSPVERGDIVMVNDPTDSLRTSVDERRVLLLRCKAVPGDKVTPSTVNPSLSTVNPSPSAHVVPGRYSCADMDYYLMEPLSPFSLNSQLSTLHSLLIPEDHIIGRAFLIIYSHDPAQSLLDGWRTDRFFTVPVLNDK